MLLLVRRAAPLRRWPVLLLAGLAAAGVGAVALTLLHRIDASAMIIGWNLGVVALLCLAQSTLGERLLNA